jgi:DNA-binding beta-propeller fold protein YncE
MTVLLPTVASAELVVGDASADVLLAVNTETGELTEYGAFVGTPHIVSLAYDQLSGMCYCTDTSEGVNQVLSIDPNTGATEMIVQVPDMFIILHSTAVDPTTGDLYAIDQHNTVLYRVDVDMGELVFVGVIGVNWITGADFDPVTGELYVCIGGLDDSGALYTVDKTTGEAQFVADTHRLMGLAFGCDGDLYGVNNYWYPNDPGLYRIDKNTGTWETIGEYPGRNIMSIECVDLDVVSTESMSWGGVKALFR